MVYCFDRSLMTSYFEPDKLQTWLRKALYMFVMNRKNSIWQQKSI